jgi:hypothetical protein
MESSALDDLSLMRRLYRPILAEIRAWSVYYSNKESGAMSQHTKATMETVIADNELASKYQISTRHGRMPTNGELRFRLICSRDGSAYIRTETTSGSQGWQKPHFHRKVCETYIVERGWIGYAEVRDGAFDRRRYEAGQVFTTEPGIWHNIYMPPEAVIHTVKHGGNADLPGEKTDWWAVPEEHGRSFAWHGPKFSSHPEVPMRSARKLQVDEASGQDPEKVYNAAYRHFDSLIWQVPAWSFGLFTVVIASINTLLTIQPSALTVSPPNRTLNAVAVLLGLTTDHFAATQLSLFGVLTLVLAFALHRFRWHQIHVKSWCRTRSSPISPQVFLQATVSLEATALLFLAATLIGMPKWISLAAIALIVGGATALGEFRLRNLNTKFHPPKRRKSDASEGEFVQDAS